jgi:hypothetical protein
MSLDHDQNEMLIRHDEQLKALMQLPEAVNKLTTALEVSNTRTTTVAAAIGVICSVLACIGTWAVMIKFH